MKRIAVANDFSPKSHRGGTEIHLDKIEKDFPSFSFKNIVFSDNVPAPIRILNRGRIPGSIALTRIIQKSQNIDSVDLIYYNNGFRFGDKWLWETEKPVISHIHDFRYICPSDFYNEKKEKRMKKHNCGKKLSCCYYRNKNKDIFKNFYQSIWKKEINYHKKLFKKHLSKSEEIIVASKFVKETYDQEGYDTSNFKVIPYYIDRKNIEYSSEHKGYLLFVAGSISRKKGWLVIKKIANKIDLDIQVIGKLNNIQIKNIPENIHLRGYLEQAEVHRAMKNALALLVPSIRPEPFGIVAIEATMAGTPIITSDYGGISEIAEKTGGKTSPPQKISEWVNHIDSIAKLQKQEYKDLSRKVRKSSEKYYSKKKVIPEYRTVFEEYF